MTANQSGLHRLDLRRLAGEGEYYLRVELVTAALASPQELRQQQRQQQRPVSRLAQPGAADGRKRRFAGHSL